MRLYWNDLVFDPDHKVLKKPQFNIVYSFKDVSGWDDICAIMKKVTGYEEKKLILLKNNYGLWGIHRTYGENFYVLETGFCIHGIDKNQKGFFRRNL